MVWVLVLKTSQWYMEYREPTLPVHTLFCRKFPSNVYATLQFLGGGRKNIQMVYWAKKLFYCEGYWTLDQVAQRGSICTDNQNSTGCCPVQFVLVKPCLNKKLGLGNLQRSLHTSALEKSILCLATWEMHLSDIEQSSSYHQSLFR